MVTAISTAEAMEMLANPGGIDGLITTSALG